MAKISGRLLQDLLELDGAITGDTNAFEQGIRSHSPSVNFIFGNTHLIPFGASAIFWGPAKGGKSLLSLSLVGQLHKDYEDAIAVRFNSELRERFQASDLLFNNFGIDKKRFIRYDVNKPDQIFDRIEKDIALACEKGLNIKLIIIDSVSDILGRQLIASDGVNQHLYGDEARTVQVGLQRIRNTIRKYNIALILIAQQRDVIDPLEQKRGKKVKMKGANYLKHFAEYFVYVFPNESSEGRADIFEKKFQDESLKDVAGNADTTALKIKVMMQDSSLGLAKRVGEFTFDKYKGIINKHEEVFRLGCARGVFDRPNNRTYILKDYEGKELKWTSKEECILGIKNNDIVADEVLKRIRALDMEMAKNGKTDVAFNASSDDASVEFEEGEAAEESDV